MNGKEKKLLVILLLLIFLLRLYHLNTPPLETEESWRQADTESIARNYAEYDFNFFRPNLNYDGPLPNIPALEIQVTTYLIALLYKIFGQHYFLARIVPIAFFMLSAFFLYLYARKVLGFREAAFSLLVYGLLPVNLYYSRAIMPEAAALMFWIGGLYYFHCWAEERRIPELIASSLLLSFAIMTKPPVIFIALPMLYTCYRYLGRNWFRFPELWIYAAVVLLLPSIYYYTSISMAEYKFSLGITQNIIVKKAFSAFASREAGLFFWENIPRTLGTIGFGMTVAGLFTVSVKKRVILVWFLAMFIEVILIVSAVRAPYYLIFFAVPCSLLAGNFLGFVRSVPKGKVAAAVLLLLFSLNSYHQVKPMYTVNTVMQTQVSVVKQVTSREDLLVVGSFDPCLLSLSGRKGWRFNLGIYSDIPQDPYEELAYYLQLGAKYFVPVQGKVYGDEGGVFLRYLEKEYIKKEPVKGFPVYLLVQED